MRLNELLVLVGIFLGEEARDRVLIQSSLLLLVKHEADHSGVADGVKLSLRRFISVGNQLRQLTNREMYRIGRHVGLQAVLEVGHEAEIILELYQDGLIIVRLPPATYLGIVTLVELTILAKATFSSIIRPYLDLPNVFSVELKGLAMRENLHPIRNLMRAQFALLKQVEHCAVLSHVKVPYGLFKLLSEAVDRLVCADLAQQRRCQHC